MAAPSEQVLKPIKKKTRLYEDVVQQITGMIERGRLKPGDRLPTERELVVQLEVSRSSVREALRALELMGIIESRVKEGTFIKDISMDLALLKLAQAGAVGEKRVLEMYQVRSQLEALSARLAAQNRTEEHVARLRRTVDTMREQIAYGERGQNADKEFHRIVAEAAGNGVLAGILVMCSDVLHSSIAESNAHANVNVLVKEHRDMCEAIEKGDDKRAERLMREHIQRAYDRAAFLSKKSKEA